MKFQS
jgi:hypothetical protein